ncbi:S-layer homology domain-containing protein [Thermophilibacter mediterraneus]|uniref:S-layer homology domain-containing protein n=1 Tax=Thermophilibacter mediterraneus TaxID=1871031 RepID=UPI00320A7FCA
MSKRLRSCMAVVMAAFFALAVMVVPKTAWADNKQSWTIKHDTLVLNGDEAGTCPGHTIDGSDTWGKIEVTGGTHTITLNNCSYTGREGLIGAQGCSAIDVRSGASLTINLVGSNELVAGGTNHPGIWVEGGATLTIEGSGSLVARGSGDSASLGAAGIGGAYDENAFGNIVINGGRIEAYGAGGGAGIGGGYKVGGGSQSGNITITGGFVQAFGGEASGSSGAGIGSGENADFEGTITISGGVVRAMGGDENKASIGGGGSFFGSTDNGIFTTGENGNAVIAAPWGIGDQSGVADWDCILLDATRGSTTDIQFVDYDTDSETVTFNGGTPRVYGDVEADYNIVVNSPASLRVSTEMDLDNDPSTQNSSDPATLTMKSGSTLTNNNSSSDPGLAGIALEPGSTLVLEDGTSQCLGDGIMIATSAEGTTHQLGKVRLPLSDDMVSVNPTSFVYDGTEKKPTATVSFPKWSFRQVFLEGTDYSVTYDNNINVGTAKATATSLDSGDLLQKDGQASTGIAEFNITLGDFSVSTVTKRYVQVGEDQLLSKLPSEPTFSEGNPPDVDGGEFKWYSDQGCTVALTNDFVKDKTEGDKVTVYWKYTQTGNKNVPAEKTGPTILVMTDNEPPKVSVDGQVDDISLTKTYGDAAFTPIIMISISDDSWFEPVSDVTYELDSATPANGDVVTVDSSTGKITIEGAGRATVVARIDGFSGLNPDGSDAYGPAYVTIDIIVLPKKVNVDEGSVSAKDRVYDGTTKVDVSASLDVSDIANNDLDQGKIGLAASGVANTPAAGIDIPVTVTYELTGEKADDYELRNNPQTTVTISKAQAGEDTLNGKSGELTIYNDVERTYEFDLNQLVPATKPVSGGALVPGDITFTLGSVTVTDKNYFDAFDVKIYGKTLRVSVSAVDSDETTDLGTITLNMVSPNFDGMTGTITVKRENQITHTINASADKGGKIDPTGVVSVVAGADQTFTITPDRGYEVADVRVDGTSVGAVTSHTFEKVIVNHTIEATFRSTSGGGSVTPSKRYTITATAGEGGTISPSGTVSVREGADKTFTVTPDEGWTVGDVTVDGVSYRQLGSYTFEDVRADHTISVTFMRGNDPANPDDTGVSDWLETDDHIVFLHGYGDGSGTFGPENQMTRAEVAQMFYNLLLDKSRGDKPVNFTDVPADAYYAEPVFTLASLGIVNGTSPETFEPNRPITRAEFVAIAMRFTNGEFEGENLFVDVPEDAWYRDYVVGAVGYGWIYGYQDGSQKFGPLDTITRGQATMVTNRMLWRACDTVWAMEHMDQLKTFVDLGQSHYAFFDVVEATNAHDYTRVGDTRYENWTGLVK